MIKILAKIDNFLQLTCVLLVILFLGDLGEFDEHSCKLPWASHTFQLSSVPGVWTGWAVPVIFPLCLMVNSCNGKAMARRRGCVGVGWGGSVSFPAAWLVVFIYSDCGSLPGDAAPPSNLSWSLLILSQFYQFLYHLLSVWGWRPPQVVTSPEVWTTSSRLPKPHSYVTASLLNFYSIFSWWPSFLFWH